MNGRYLDEMRSAILACNRDRFNRLMFYLGAINRYETREVEQLSRRLLAEAPHDVQVYWKGTCSCGGHLP